MKVIKKANDGTLHTYESGCELIDVTSAHRPDTTWCEVDAYGHEHRWYMDGEPASNYSPKGHFTTPSLVWVKDNEWYDEDGEVHERGHCECRLCGQHVNPRNTADQFRQYVAGLRWYRIDGMLVDREEFERRVKEAQGL